jgi:thiol-disulfide isomerase/thioredoxin
MVAYNYGIQGHQAPQWGVEKWFNLPDEKQRIDLPDFSSSVIYLYCFQSWCPGCHSHGFPTLLNVMEQFRAFSNVAFVAVQTVFEGFEVNTAERARETAEKYQLTIPVGHDPGPDGRRSLIMQRYRTGGTPWAIVIDSKGTVRYNDFRADAYQMTDLINQLRQSTSK